MWDRALPSAPRLRDLVSPSAGIGRGSPRAGQRPVLLEELGGVPSTSKKSGFSTLLGLGVLGGAALGLVPKRGRTKRRTAVARAARGGRLQSGRAWTLLGLEPGADKQEIRKKYRKLVAAEHPDKHPGDPLAAERFNDIQMAYEELMDGASGSTGSNLKGAYGQASREEAAEFFKKYAQKMNRGTSGQQAKVRYTESDMFRGYKTPRAIDLDEDNGFNQLFNDAPIGRGKGRRPRRGGPFGPLELAVTAVVVVCVITIMYWTVDNMYCKGYSDEWFCMG